MSSPIYFFTDVDVLSAQNANPVLNTDAFGPVFNEEDTKFRITSLHKSSNLSYNPRVIAICEGSVCIRFYDDPNDANLISIILKPSKSIKQISGINFVPIKYIVYKGVLKSSLVEQINSTTYKIQNTTPNHLTQRLYEIQNRINREKENIQDPQAPIGSITDLPSSSLLRHDITFSPTADIDNLFFRSPDQEFQIPLVKAGWHIGQFDPNKFGIEIILDDARTNYPLENAQKTEILITAPVSTGNTPSEIMFRKMQKEKILNYIDPCTFYGSLYNSKIRFYNILDSIVLDPNSNAVISGYNEVIRNGIYDQIMPSFANKNISYVDIRNDFNQSYNFLGNYDNTIRLKIDSNIYDVNYYSDNLFNSWKWPVLSINPQSFPIINNSDNFNLIEVALPFINTENPYPIGFLSQGYLKQKHRRDFPKEVAGRHKFVYIRNDSNEPFSTFIRFAMPNNNGQPSIVVPISTYTKLKLSKKSEPNVSSNLVFRKKHFLDLVFQPFIHLISFDHSLLEKTFIRVFDEEHHFELPNESFSGSVGVASDIDNVTFFSFARESHKLKPTTPVSLTSEVSNHPDFFTFLRKKYPDSNLVKGPIDPSSSSREFLRFVKPFEFKDLFTSNKPRFDREFQAIVLKKATVASFINSSDFDTFISLSNELFYPETSTSPAYTSYDLNLSSYVDDGVGNLSIAQSLSTSIKIYGHGEKPNILVEEFAFLPVIPASLASLDCFKTFAQLQTDTDKKDDLLTFVNEMKVHIHDVSIILKTSPPPNRFTMGETVTNIPSASGKVIYQSDDKINLRLTNVTGTFNNSDVITGGTSSLSSTIDIVATANDGLIRLFINVFDDEPTDPSYPNCFHISGALGSVNIIPPTTGPSTGFLAEAAYTFAMWRLNKKLQSDLTNPFSPTTVYSPLFTLLVQTLRDDGFLFSTPITLSDFNDIITILTPSLIIGQSNYLFYPNSTSPEPSRKLNIIKLMARGNYSPGSQIFNYTLPLPDSRSTRRAMRDTDAINGKKIAYIFGELTQIISDAVLKESNCLYSSFADSLGLIGEKPISIFLATGDGSTTVGILGNRSNENVGILFFSYDFDTGTAAVKPTYSKKFTPRTGGARTVIHLSIMGMDYGFLADSTVNVKIQDVGATVFQTAYFTASYSTPILTPFSAGYLPTSITTTSGVTTFVDRASGISFATYNQQTGDLNINKVGTSFEVSVELSSADGHDEVQCMVCVVDGPLQLPPIEIATKGVYPADKFILTKTDKCDLLKQPVGALKVKDGIDTLIDIILAMQTTDKIIMNCHGNFVGKKKDPTPTSGSLLEFYTDYNFEDRLRQPSGPRTIESVISSGDLSLQYSYASISYSDQNVIIDVESYVSPLISKLACTIRPLVNQNQDPNNVELLALNAFTLYGCPSTDPLYNPDAYVTTNSPCPPAILNDIPSYNPVLSALRSFGLLDGIRSCIKKRAEVSGKNSTQIAAILSKFDTALGLAKVPKSKSLGLAKDLTLADFLRFKWDNYTDNTTYGDIDPSTSCE